MKDILRWAFVGFFGVIALAIVFVKAGRGGGKSGGDQAATIVSASAKGIADIGSSLEGS